MKAALNDALREREEGDSDYEERKGIKPNPNIEKIINQLRGNINLIFTNGDLADVKAVIDEEIRPSPAKAGMIAPKDVFVPPGPTGLDPKQTGFFQNLQIQTKIVKAQIEIVAEKQVVFKGEKVDSTQAMLLEKLKIYPFEYKMEIRKFMQNGQLFDAAVLELTPEIILGKFKRALSIQSALSLGAGFPTQASAPHSVLNAFKNLVAASAESGFEFAQATSFLQAAKNAPAAGAASAGGAKAAAPEETKQEEEEDVEMGNLFGGDEEDY
jgi:large subunit ribosomal protein LP0